MCVGGRAVRHPSGLGDLLLLLFLPQRSPSTTTPPRVHTPQIAPAAQAQGSFPSVAFQHNMVHPAAYVIQTPTFPVPQTRIQKRGESPSLAWGRSS